MKSEIALRKIIEAGEVKKDDVILEIGPGKGALTEKLLERIYPHPASPYVGGGAKGGGGMVIAVEKDRELFEFLKVKFEKEINIRSLILVHDNILNFNTRTYNLEPRTYKVIANIPYNITGAILKKFLTEENQPESMVLMVQNEVAKRITTPNPSSTRRGGKESILSISVKAYGEPKMIMKVEKRYFSPQPKVDSAVITIKNISRKIFETPPQPSPKEREESKSSPLGGGREGVNEDKFWKIVKAGFAHKRKKLSSNLKGILACQGAPLTLVKDKRAEDLALADWIALAKM
ncbi:MAG: 16S rRNA (adenine1518-N6/adenine1519-N6)-dimethyltransferase [Parcubacteria group bacterium Gr01-1014_24]|nr:MAG: 16S rRNA (adenine1518-N6/adenine1519-N6)-dimethyltransferase [Parcubacteria group bacterium Gr01-1014_24]